MSTPSFIGVLCKEGIIKFVYCHSDGYPSYLGKMLLEHYNTPELATALVDLGSLSMVRERLAPDEGETHRFDKPVRHGLKGVFMSNPKKAVSPVDEFIKVFYEMSARYGRSELWYDYIDMHAIALANTCDLRCRDTREEQYNAIVQKYDEKTVQQFAVLTAITMTALLENPEQDFLGTVYHNLGLSKSQAGQFFTPYNVGQMMARMSMPDSFVLDKSRVWRVNDPCCGAGCLLLAGYNAMREQLESTDPDWDKYVLFVAQDIDPLACKMCYIQMCCIGVPGVVVAGNSLFPDAEREPTDFWFTHKYFALDEKAFENAYQQTKE